MKPADILLVEDNPLDAKATFSAARKLEMTNAIHVATDGRQALDYLRHPPDSAPGTNLVLLDLDLPGLSGRDVLREIRSDRAICRTPVVILTTSSEMTDVHDAYGLGANAYITKPDNLDGWFNVLSTIHQFWLSVARLPDRTEHDYHVHDSAPAMNGC